MKLPGDGPMVPLGIHIKEDAQVDFGHPGGGATAEDIIVRLRYVREGVTYDIELRGQPDSMTVHVDTSPLTDETTDFCKAFVEVWNHLTDARRRRIFRTNG